MEVQMKSVHMVHPDAAFHGRDAAQRSDLIQILWRWKWLPVLGALLGVGCGFLKFRTEPPTYSSTALLQVAYPTADAAAWERDDADDKIRGQSRMDESLIIKSDRVIRLAAKSITEQPPKALAGMSEDEVIEFIRVPRRMSVEPAARDSSSALINISFVCTDAEVSQHVVQGLIDGYESYLGDAYRNWGEEVVDVVTQAQDNLQRKYANLSREQLDFLKMAPGTWTGEEIHDPHAEDLVAIKSEITSIQIEKQKLSGTLEHVQQSQAAKRPPEGILVMLAADATFAKEMFGDEAAPEKSTASILPALSEQKKNDLAQMEMREAELLDTLGESHPTVAAMRRRIRLLKSHIASLIAAEREAQQAEADSRSESGQKELTPERRVELWKSALGERVASLALQEQELSVLAADAEKRSKELQAYIAQSKVLKSEMSSIEQLMAGYTATLNRLQTMPKGTQTSLQVLTPPAVGGFFGPRLAPYLLGGAGIGMIALSGLALLLDWSEKSFRDPDEISQQLGLPILGHIPQIPTAAVDPSVSVHGSLATLHRARSAASEAYRSVRTGLYFRENADSLRVLQVTSPVPGDGKSTLSANLAITIAQSGRRVLLIDADFRRPRIAALFHMESSAGMAEVMMGRLAWRDALTTTPVPGLTVLPSGRPPANPAELLSSPRFAALIATLREEFQYVIIDTPPLLAVSDPCAVAAVADGVILNIRLRRNARPLAAAAAQLLESVKARVVGVVVNGVGNANRYGYHNSKYSAYYHDARVPAPEPLANDSDLDLPALVAPRTRSRLSS